MEDKPHPLLSRAMDFEAPRHQQVPPTVPRARLFLQTHYHLSRRVIVIILSSFSPTGSMPDIPPPAHHAFGRCRRSVNGGPHVQVEDRLACGFWRGRVVVYHISDFAYGAVRGPAFDVPVVAVKWGFAAASLPLLASYSKSKGEEGGMKEMMISWGEGVGGGIRKLGWIYFAHKSPHPCLGRDVIRSALEPNKLWLQFGLLIRYHAARPASFKFFLAQRTHLPSVAEATTESLFPSFNLVPSALVEEVVHGDHGLYSVFGRVVKSLA